MNFESIINTTFAFNNLISDQFSDPFLVICVKSSLIIITTLIFSFFWCSLGAILMKFVVREENYTTSTIYMLMLTYWLFFTVLTCNQFNKIIIEL